ncbi:MAG TPA: glutathione S-transferase family protein [Myxococcota bacterium]|nr:glutathione S-transferase family protein [Myxococcota bacterium]
MIRLHTWTTPNGRKISVALEELGLPYEVHPVNLGANEQMTPAFLALNPNHKIPVLEDDGLVIWESGAILLHLGEKYGVGKILPADPKGRIAAIQYAFFQAGGIGPNLGRLFGQIRKPEAERNAEMVTIFREEVARLLGVLERVLDDGRPYLAGDYSIGDIMHYPWLAPMRSLGARELADRPKVCAWLDRIGSRPAVQRGMAIPKV